MLPASSTSRHVLPLIATAAKLLLVLLLSGWLLLALGWALLHGWIVPRLDEWRPQLQTLARQATGLHVDIGELSARSTGLFPSFELRQVRVLDEAGRSALELPQVLVALSPRAALTLGLEQLVIRGADLDIRRSADGRLWLAGVPVWPKAGPGDRALADWLLSQQEWALQGGTLRWTDEQHGVNLVLTEVDAVMRNPGQRHSFRLDATPPAEWGERFSLRGDFRQPLLSRSPSDWAQWSGQLYGQFSRIDLAPLQAYARLAEVTLTQGRGALRLWAEVAQGRITGASADVALAETRARLAPRLPVLGFDRLAGRVGWQARGGQGLDLKAESLSFDTSDGLHWPGGDLTLKLDLDAQGQATGGEFTADRLDLQALALLSQRLPLPAGWSPALQELAPQGIVQQMKASWQGPPSQPVQLSARGRIQGLVLAAGRGDQAHRPGLSGLNLDFRAQRESGQDKLQASFNLSRGWLEFPAVFQEPRIPLDKLAGEFRLTQGPRGTEAEIRQGVLQGADAQGQFQASWRRTADGDPRGTLELQGQLSRADGARVWRYLPLGVAERAREYVRSAIQQGQLSDVRFKVKGPLSAFPFERPDAGEFLITGKLRGASYAYVPARLQESGTQPWPALTQLDAELVFNRASLQVLKAQARVQGHPGLVVPRAEARIEHLGRQPVVEVSGQIRGPLQQALAVVNQSPLSGMTRRALAGAAASGPAEVQLKLALPLDNLAGSRVQGSVALAGNDVQLAPEAPPMGRLRGSIGFSESGFQVSNAQARMLGGDLRFDGGMRPAGRAGEPEIVFRGQGMASAEALAQWRELADLAPLLRHASGSAAYSATLSFVAGALDLQVQSNLAGLGLALPEPLGKTAAASLPLKVDKTVLRESAVPGRRLQDRLSVSVGAGTAQPLWASYLRDISGARAQVLGGQIGVGMEPGGETGEREVRARVQLPRLDFDAWTPLLGTGLLEEAGAGEATGGYLPTSFQLRAGALRLRGHEFQNVVLGARREASIWKATLSASELNGHGEYRLPAGGNPGRLYARLSRLNLGESTASEMEALLDSQPASIPALDIVIDDLELLGKKLGRLEVEAVNRNLAGREGSREWRLSRLRLSVPEATLTASGSWAAPPTAAAGPRNGPVRRQTQLNFKLDVGDSGELLQRLGLEDALRRGKGRLEGQIGWTGSPLALHYPSLTGQLSVDVEEGQFLKAEPGAAKLLGVLSLQSLPRRLSLDFRDVFSEGFAFDWVRGNVQIHQGVASTHDLRMKGVSAAVLMEGSADLARETQDLRVVVVPEINAGTASLLAATVNPAVALGTFVAQWLLRQPLNQATTQEFQITGPWKDPQIQRIPRQRAPAQAGPAAEARP